MDKMIERGLTFTHLTSLFRATEDPKVKQLVGDALVAISDLEAELHETHVREAKDYIELLNKYRDSVDAHDKTLTIIASAYQFAGAHDAPELWLDVLSDPEAATDEQVNQLLPYVQLVDNTTDGAMWRALISSPYLRILGTAGFGSGNPGKGEFPDERGYRHFGLEAWSMHGYTQEEVQVSTENAREILTKYAEVCLQLQRKTSDE